MSRILKNVHRSANDPHDAGLLDTVTMREFDALCLPPLRNDPPQQIRQIRARGKAGQAVLASILNVGAATVAAWEQGTKKPSRPPARLFNLVDRKGLQVLLA